MSRGTGSPKPPPTSKIGLTEVERAISVLEGRHPEHEKIRRQTREAAEQRRSELAIELARNAARRRRRAIAAGAGAAGAVAAVVFGLKVAQRARALDAALEQAASPWIARGFVRLASNALTSSQTLEVDLPPSSCFVATATVEGRLRALVDGSVLEGPRPIAWCSCGRGHATIKSPAGAASVGLIVLRVDASDLGGPLARSWSGFTAGAWGDGGRECADAMLDGWIAARHWPTPTQDEGWLDADPSRAPLRRAGLRVIASIGPSRRFGVVETAAADCAMAVSTPDEMLSLRLAGGARPVSRARGSLAWCSSTATTVTVWRDGSSPVAVLSSPASRIGGLLGTRECAEEAGVHLGPEATFLRDEDLPWDAAALLRASTLPDVTTSALPADPGARDARVVALALSRDASAAWEPEAAVVACDPPLSASGGLGERICAPSGPVSWFNRASASAGLARAPLPLWMSSLEATHREVESLERVLELLSLARRLARDGFEPTRLEGITELPRGVRITGRAGEDAVVAVGLAPSPPWAFPYSDGPPWSLAEAPRIVDVKAGDTVTLTSSPISSAPLSERRTVVFRHVASP